AGAAPARAGLGRGQRDHNAPGPGPARGDAVEAVRLPDREPRREGGDGAALLDRPGRTLPRHAPGPPLPRPAATELTAFPSLKEALNKVSNRYLLVVLSAKRARQLNRRASPPL